MQRYKVRIPGFKFVAIQRDGVELPDVVTPTDLQPEFTEGFEDEHVRVQLDDGKVGTITRKHRVSRRMAGRQVLREWLAVEAHSDGEAQGLFHHYMGLVKNTQPEKGYEVEALDGEPQAATPAPAIPRKRSRDERVREAMGGRVPTEE